MGIKPFTPSDALSGQIGGREGGPKRGGAGDDDLKGEGDDIIKKDKDPVIE